MRLSSLLCLALLSPATASAKLDSYAPASLALQVTSGAASALRYTLHALNRLTSPSPHHRPRKRAFQNTYHQCLLIQKPSSAQDTFPNSSNSSSNGSTSASARGSAPATWGIGGDATTVTRSVPPVTSDWSISSQSEVLTAASGTDSSASASTSSSTTQAPPTTSQAPATSPAPPPTSQAQPTTSQPAPPPPPSSIWNVVETYSGQSFFDGFSFWDDDVDGGDPTHGSVDYVNQQTAQQLGLIGINPSAHAILAVSTASDLSPTNNARASVRLSTTRTFTGGLLVADIHHLPTGCGTWPSFWTCGPAWPHAGEIDVVEGVHDAAANTASVHTDPGCSMPADYGASGRVLMGGAAGLDCSAVDTNDAGCGLVASTPGTYGAPFNDAGGGVYAMQWDETGIAVFFFPRGSIPSDIPSGYPDPTGWGTPLGRWPASTCSPYEYFYNHVAIFDTTLCGDWAGAVWDSPALGAGASCAQTTGYATCDAFVRANGSAFADAYWEIASVVLYQKNGQGA